jgi:basic membrane lipoprotein Med (substrate-binding protein (PBP1-ABC) superfamily)
LSAIAEGADFVIHQANAAAKGVFEACKEKGVLAFGANLNQNDDSTGVVCASAVIVAGPAFLSLAQEVQSGTFKGGIALKGMQDGAIDFILNPALQGKLSAESLAKVKEAQEQIKKGSLTVPKDDF